MYIISHICPSYLHKMEASQALMKFKNKNKNQNKNQNKTKTKTKTKTKSKTDGPKRTFPILRISQRQYDWYSRLCPNFNETTMHIVIET